MRLLKPFGVSMIFYVYAMIVYYILSPFSKGANTIPFVNTYYHQYALIPCLALFILLLLFHVYLKRQKGFKKPLQTILFFFLWYLLSAIPGGVLWAYHDMGTTGYIALYPSFFHKALHNVRGALGISPYALLISFPSNFLHLGGFFFLIRKFYNRPDKSTKTIDQ